MSKTPTTVGADPPENEADRLEELQSYQILDTLPEEAYDDLTYLASQICGSPIALISLVDRDRQWFKSRIGVDVAETPRNIAFCAHAILEPNKLFVIPDARRDERFSDNPLVVEDPSIRFYAGAPLVSSKGHALGTLCVIDQRPRELSEEQKKALCALSRQVVTLLDLRQSVAKLRRHSDQQRQYEEQLKEYQKKLETSNELLGVQSITDSLTGLYNRRAFYAKLEEESERARRYDLPLSLALLDVDAFKSYNDAFGHPAGDEALRRVAQMLNEHKRHTDFVARHGGEEFAIILVNTDAAGGILMAERFRQAIEQAGGFDRQVTASFGIAANDGSEQSPSKLIKDADRALYRAKESGRNRVERASLDGDDSLQTDTRIAI